MGRTDGATPRGRCTAIESIAAWAKAAGASALLLDVVADNTPAIALYERSGFLRLDGEAPGELASNEIRLVRSLATVDAHATWPED